MYGGYEMAEIVSYAKSKQFNFLFSEDFVIEYFNHTLFNSFDTISYLLSQFNASETWGFFLHFIVSIILFSGIYKLGHSLLKHEWLPYLLIFVLCIPPFQGHSLLPTDLYTPYLSNGLITKTCIVWGIISWLSRKSISFTFLMGMSIFFTPLIAIHFWVLIISTGIIFHFVRKKRAFLNFKKWVIPHLLIFAMFSVWVVFYSKQLFPNEYLWQRLSHIFFNFKEGSSYELDRSSGYLLYIVVSFSVCSYTFRYHTKLLTFILTFLLYTVAICFFSFLETGTFFGHSWFDILFILELITLIAIFKMLYTFVKISILKEFETGGKYLFYAIITAFSGFITNPNIIFSNQLYVFPWKDQSRRAEIDIAEKTRILTEPNSLFITPPYFSFFKPVSERSTLTSLYFEAKTPWFRSEWIDRTISVYGINPVDRQSKETKLLYALAFYKNMDDQKINDMKQKYCITHAILPINHPTIYPTIIQNAGYKLIEL